VSKYTVISPAKDEDGGGCRCPHPLKPHVLVMLNKADVLGTPDVPVSGLMFCPSCDCTAAWAVRGFPVPEMPPEDELAALRLEVLGA
jgi:hypothetical protein